MRSYALLHHLHRCQLSATLVSLFSLSHKPYQKYYTETRNKQKKTDCGDNDDVSTIEDGSPPGWVDGLFIFWIICINIYYIYQFTDYSLSHINRELQEIIKTNEHLQQQTSNIEQNNATLKYQLTKSLIVSNTIRSNTFRTPPNGPITAIEGNISSIPTILPDMAPLAQTSTNATVADVAPLSKIMMPKDAPKFIRTKSEVEVKRDELMDELHYIRYKFDYSIENDFITLARPLQGVPNKRCCLTCFLCPWSHTLLSWSRTQAVRFFLRLWTLLSCSLAFVLWIEFFGNWFLEVCLGFVLCSFFVCLFVCFFFLAKLLS